MKLIEPKYIENIICENVKPGESRDIVDNVAPKMYELLLKNKGAVGIAAPQVGIFKKFFIVRIPDSYMLVFNPFYIKDGSRVKIKESCLSYGLSNYKEIKRYKSIYVVYDKSIGGELVREKVNLKTPLSIIFQHEIDHLNGITIFNK